MRNREKSVASKLYFIQDKTSFSTHQIVRINKFVVKFKQEEQNIHEVDMSVCMTG